MRIPTLLPLLLAGLFGACSGDELVGVHVRLEADGSGTLTTRSLLPRGDATPAESRAKGVDFQLRAALVSSQGAFGDIAQVTLGDGEVTFAPQLGGDRPGLRVTVARGPDRKWISALTPDRAGREQLAKAYDPTGRTAEIGDVLRLELYCPGSVVTSGVLPTGRGVEADRDGRRALLLLPVRTAREAGDAFVWDVSWLKP